MDSKDFASQCCGRVVVISLVALLLHTVKAFVSPHPRSFSLSSHPLLVASDKDSSWFSLGDNDAASASTTTTVIAYDDFLPQPNTEWDSLGVLHACMGVLLERKDAGLEVCFNFSSDRCRAALGGSLEAFAQYATNPIFGVLVNCHAYDVVSVGPMIAGTRNRGAMQTVLMNARTEGNEDRRFLWTFQQERRPPRQGCWIIHEVIYVKNAFMLTV